MISPLLRLVLAQSPRRSAVVSVVTVSRLCARARTGTRGVTSVHRAGSNLLIYVMASLCPGGVDSEPLHATIKIRPVSLQSSRCICDVSACLSQCARDHGSLEAVQFVGQ